MRERSAFFAACCIAATALSVLLAGCESSESKAQEAYGEYQAAIAGGDLLAARRALRAVVAIKDDDPTIWAQLGNIQLQLQDNEGAYSSFTRAHELDRTNVGTLAALTQLALLSGNPENAEKHANELELVAPGHPAVKLAYGYLFLQRQEFDQADAQADSLLQTLPYEPGAKLLKARILLGRNEPEKAIALLQDQVRVQPQDSGSWKALMLLGERQNDWKTVRQAARRLRELNPKDQEVGVTVVEASLRTNDFETALRDSESLLTPDAPPDQVNAVLELWAKHWKASKAIVEARRLAKAASAQQRLAYATFFNEAGSPQDATALIGSDPSLPVNAANMSVNSVIATSLALRGDRDRAKQIFDAILAHEPDHVYALRGRTNLEIETRNGKAAILDAQRLVSVEPNSARHRILLARAYAAAGDSREADRTLWDAFHEIPGDFDAYETLRARVQRTGDEAALSSLDEEFKHQRDDLLAREFI
jgi:predicted Zn-dependent protease